MSQNLLTSPILYHDYFAIRGGGERLALTLSATLGADLVFGYKTESSFQTELFPKRLRSLNLFKFLQRPGLRPLILALLFRMESKSAKTRFVRFFSGSAAPFAAPPLKYGGKNIYYCHTPPRFLFDQRTRFLNRIPWALRPLAILALFLYERAYRGALARMHIILTNSKNTQARLLEHMGLNSSVVYPPIETANYVWSGQSDYYLSTARLSPLKRVDRIVSAFMKMPDKKLVVASGGSELNKLKALANGAPNIRFTGWTSDQELQQLMGKAIASLYLPHDEDFGMSPVESMAAGKPVIGVAEGGLLETIRPQKTGILLPPDFTDGDLVEAVKAMTPQSAQSMRTSCEKQAQKFSKQQFEAAIKDVLDKA